MDVQAIGGLRFGTLTAIGGGGRAGSQFAVAQDQQLEGTVVSIDHDSVVIQVGGQRVAATTDASVRPGDVLQMIVRETGADQVLMQIVGRGGAPLLQTRQLTRQELASELTNVGVQPDDESIAVAGELLARGEPLTAQNVMDVRSAVARAAQAPVAAGGVALAAESLPASATASQAGATSESFDSTDVRAAVFLKSQGLPVTPAAIQIVRQAWTSQSALGEHVEQLRDALADLAARLTQEAVGTELEAAPATAGEGVVRTAADEPEGLAARGAGQ